MGRKSNGLVRTIIIVLVALTVLAFIFVTIFMLTTFRIDVEGDAMLPTLSNGERLQVNPADYNAQPLQRGDIVVFVSPLESKNFIKRVVALEGETLEIKADPNPVGTPGSECGGCGVYINGVLLREDYVRQNPDYNYGPETVGKGFTFVLGDNRRNSADSHVFGPLDVSTIKGKAIFAYFPELRMLDNPSYK